MSGNERAENFSYFFLACLSFVIFEAGAIRFSAKAGICEIGGLRKLVTVAIGKG